MELIHNYKKNNTNKNENQTAKELAYMTGVYKQYLPEGFVGLNTHIRTMCGLRNTLLEYFSEINDSYKAGTPLSEISWTGRLVTELAERGIVLDDKASLSQAIVSLNKHITDAVAKVAGNFSPLPATWVNALFNMPDGDTVAGVQVALRRYRQWKNYYPYQRYVNLPMANTPEDVRGKYLFASDEELFARLQAIHTYRPELLDFCGEHQPTLIVDCENSDPDALYETILPVIGFIKKIILINDENGSKLWDVFENEFKSQVALVHDKCVRVKQEKSLVDLQMVVRTCEEFFANGCKSFLLATSDSDIWAMIKAIPSAKICVLAEPEKCADAFTDTLCQNGIKCLHLCSSTRALQDKALYPAIKDAMGKVYVDLHRIVCNAAQSLNLYLPREDFERYINDIAESISFERDGIVLKCRIKE
jgi:hypothetical protein